MVKCAVRTYWTQELVERAADNIKKKISLARRTLYSLIKTDVHGSNGLNPKNLI